MEVVLTIVLIFFGSNNAVLAGPSPDTGHEIIPLDQEFLKATAATPSHDLDQWGDWERWDSPQKIATLAPFYRIGHDLEGLPLFVCEFGKWNYRELAKLPQEEQDAFHKHLEFYDRSMSKDAAANQDHATVLIMDFDGFEMGHFATSKALKLALKTFTSIITFNRSIKYVVSINTNYAAETFLNLAKPFLGEFLEKFEFYGTQSETWKPALLRKIPQDQLPPKYGGNKQ